MRIGRAFCVELDREVDIEAAKIEFFAQAEYSKFTFLCSDPNCRYSKSSGVRVAAVNHNKLPLVDIFFITPHFRKWDEHTETCEWVEIEEARLQDENKGELSLEEAAKKRLIQKKVSQLITQFIPPGLKKTTEDNGAEAQERAAIRNLTNKDDRIRKYRDYLRGAGSKSRSLDSLVTCYEELKSLDALDMEIHIVGGKTKTTYQNLFRHILNSQNFAPPSLLIFYGGARLKKRYGQGFALNFFDKYNGKNVTLYVSSKKINEYKPAQYLARIVDQISKIDQSTKSYIKVYFIGNIIENIEQNEYQVELETLAHLTLRLVTSPKDINTKQITLQT